MANNGICGAGVAYNAKIGGEKSAPAPCGNAGAQRGTDLGFMGCSGCCRGE